MADDDYSQHETQIKILKHKLAKSNPFDPNAVNMDRYKRAIAPCFKRSLNKLVNTAILYAYDQKTLLLEDIEAVKNLKARRTLINKYNTMYDAFIMLYFWYSYYAPKSQLLKIENLVNTAWIYRNCPHEMWIRLFCKYYLDLSGENMQEKITYYRTAQIRYELKNIYAENPSSDKEELFDKYYSTSDSRYQAILDTMRD